MKERIELTDSIQIAIAKMVDGNIGATTALIEIAKSTPIIDPQSALGPFSVLLALDRMGLYGSDIWIVYKDICKQDTLKVQTLFRAIQLGFYRESDLLSLVQQDRRGLHSDQTKQVDFDDLLAKVQGQLTDFNKPSEAA